jgi:DNA-binding transcriptional ArsR family regulator
MCRRPCQRGVKLKQRCKPVRGGLDSQSVSCSLRLVETYTEVFERLRGGPRSVGEIAQGMDMTRRAVSQHLKVLKAARLVVDRAEGTRRLYGVEAQGLKALRSWLDGFWDDALAAFKEAADEKPRRKNIMMNNQTVRESEQANSLRKVVRVKAPQDVAWRTFTEKMGTWWPLATHKIGNVKAVDAVIEPRVGGR